ncbi:MAG TPA: PKD domain-containing protein, partial [Chitinophagales bacterium]|nr:PKD domain-containing protein [Chitinophagales bacterium]
RRMRVRCTYASVPTDPCMQYTYGETEDYTVQVGPPITYLWSTGATTEDISGLAPGPYTVTVTDGTTSSTLNFNVGQPSQVISNVTAGGPTTICPGQDLTLNASGTPTWNYSWSNGATGNSVTINQPGTYTVTVSNSNGCSTTDDIEITSATSTAPPVISPADTSLVCEGSSITLSVPASYNPTWIPGGQTTPSIDVDQSGEYSVSYTDANGCTGVSEPVTVMVIPPPAVTITPSGPTTFCQGGTVTLTSNYMAGNSWSTGAATSSITVTTSGTYSLTVSAGGTCSDDESITVTVNPVPAVQITPSGPTSFCQGGNVTLTATPAGSTYNWSNGSNLAQQSVTSTSNFSVTVTDANGCSGTAGPVDVIVNPTPAPPFVTASGALELCDGETVMLWSSYFSGNTWSNGQTGSDITVTQSGTYSVTYTDAIGCSSVSQATTVTVNPSPTSTFTMPSTACVIDNATVTYTGSASASAAYFWDFGTATASGSGQGPYTLTFGGVGTYTVTLYVEENGCSSPVTTQSISVNENPAADFSLSAGQACIGDEVTVTYTGGAPAAALYTWSFGSATVSSGSGAGPYALNGDVADTVLISLVVTLGSCESEPFTVPLVITPLPVVTFSAAQTMGCDSLTTQFQTNVLGGSYAWSFGNGALSVSASPTQSFAPGNYSVTLSVVDANGCAGTATVPNYIGVYATPVAAFASTPPLEDTLALSEATIDFDNNSQNAVSYLWSFGDGMTSTEASPVYAYLGSGLYTVELIAYNPAGCADTAHSETFFVAPGAVLFVPNTFTPNNDGHNDVFRVYSNLIKGIHLMVFDRIGQKVFETNDPQAGWTGYFKGQPMNTGVFVWHCKVEYVTGDVEELFGDVTLIR